MNIDQNILEIIEQGNTDGNLYFLPNQQLDRKTYLSVNKVLECLGGKWDRKLKAHLFESDISDAIDDVLLTGDVIDKKKDLQFFPTPAEIAERLVEIADIRPEHRVLEPSAGTGNILRAIGNKPDKVAIEIDIGNVESLASCSVSGVSIIHGDFLECDDGIGMFDRIVMNPPFTRQQDIKHVEKAMSYLKSDGVLVSVMSLGVTFRKNKRTLSFWDKVNECTLFEIFDLPQGAFKVSGTMVNAIILRIIA